MVSHTQAHVSMHGQAKNDPDTVPVPVQTHVTRTVGGQKIVRFLVCQVPCYIGTGTVCNCLDANFHSNRFITGRKLVGSKKSSTGTRVPVPEKSWLVVKITIGGNKALLP